LALGYQSMLLGLAWQRCSCTCGVERAGKDVMEGTPPRLGGPIAAIDVYHLAQL
jgi:hypothetical protein